ncbi:hypothetical protein BVRB_2g028830 [Beta vulgaris subsp. vulgaris]|nr:hypothetical protein BVRB_2g028830 [Beta vulgaris subsp. vulgaris]
MLKMIAMTVSKLPERILYGKLGKLQITRDSPLGCVAL